MNNNRRKKALIIQFLVFFILMAFVVSCNFILFFHYTTMLEEDIKRAAPITFFNIIFLTATFCVIDQVRRYFMVTRPVKKIRMGVGRVIEGDFKTKISYVRGENSTNEFDEIITGLNQMIAELGSVETLRTDFIANVSHELKTPLAVIQNYGTLLQTTDLEEEVRLEYAKKITEQTRRLSSLITNILKLNKLENEQIFPGMKQINLYESVCESMLNFENIWEEKQIEIETEFDDTIMVKADAEMLSIVWNNLMSNAVKFTDQGGKIKIRVLSDKENAIVSIEDTGCGIDAETGKNIFKKFYQGDTSHATQGNGLGLAMVKRVVDIHGGDISVCSKQNEGSIFTVKLRQYDQSTD